MSNLTQQIADDIKTAMRDRNKVALNVLRAMKTAITNAAIDKAGPGSELSDTEVTGIIRKQIKQRRDSIEQFETAGRGELAETEKNEISVLEHYLPAAMTQEELEAIVETAIAESGAESRKDIGKVMGILQTKTEGRADGKTLSQEVMKRLN